ncbi:hypothetical protein ACHAW5_004918 [Stephanodiscus triporus]|uniref:Protein kinase domain-containing protein n=1 Tax=Stephanodiscus triporus TaxID=2934178 RepID=A0ABD3PJ65_9STRA
MNVSMTFDEISAAPAPLKFSATMDTAQSSLCEDSSCPYDERRHHQHYDDDDDDFPDRSPISPCSSSEDIASAFSITGERFSDIEDKYHVDPRILGAGHHGSVRQCNDRATGQRFAVKSVGRTIHRPARRPLSRDRAAARNASGSIIRLVDVFEDADYVHIVTDLCQGRRAVRQDRQSSDGDNDAPCFEEGAAARSPLAKVASRSSTWLVSEALPERGGPMSTLVRTPYYIAPEACDLWSIGIIAYIMLCGYPPFNGADNNEVYEAIRSGRYHFHSSEWSRSSPESRNFIRHLLQKDPSQRMTVRQALNHPWIVKHVVNREFATMDDEEHQDQR